MNRKNLWSALIAIVVCYSVSVFGNTLEPLTVSPGAVDGLTGVEARCPTFSWQAVPGAVGYEVVVYQLPPEAELAEWSLDEAVEVLFVELPVGVTAWTPSLESGLARGAGHVWFVRGVMGDDATEWSVARFFRVVGADTRAETESVTRKGVGRSGTGSGTGSGSMGASSRGTNAEGDRSAMAKRVGETKTKDVSTAMAAIRGEMPDATGETYGVVGTSNSPDGAGLGAANTAGGPDLVLDGVEDGESDTLISQDGVRRSSPGIETFTFENTGGGEMNLGVIGTIHGNGSGLVDVDADTLGGIDSMAFSPSVHLHDGRYYTESELNSSGAGGSVHWDNLGSVPLGLDDGDDDTTYASGTGLALVGNVFSSMGCGYANVVVVAASGGDFTSIQAAIDSITTASGINPYLVWVAAGIYNEVVTMKSHVHLQGAGQDVTEIRSTVGNPSSPPSQATLILAGDTSVRDLTVLNLGTQSWNVAMLASAGVADVVVADVSVSSFGAGWRNWAILATDAATEITLQYVTSRGESANLDSVGLVNMAGAETTLIGGSYTGDGARGFLTTATGIVNTGSGSLIDAVAVAAVGTGRPSKIWGMQVSDGASAILWGGFYHARSFYGTYSSTYARGIAVGGATLTAVSVAVKGEGAKDSNYGLQSGGSVILKGGSFTGRGGLQGEDTRGISVVGSGATLEAAGVRALGADGSETNSGFFCEGGSVSLQGGSFTGRGGADSRGIFSFGTGTTLEATSVRALGADGSDTNYGLRNFTEGSATLHGGSFVGSGGHTSAGIFNGDATLEASNVAARGDGCTHYCIGLDNRNGADGLVVGGSFIARGGDAAYGIRNVDGAPTLNATGIAARGEAASSADFALRMNDGSVQVGSSQLWGNAYKDGGTLTCFGVYNETFTSYSCP